jgi:hypothetical protein
MNFSVFGPYKGVTGYDSVVRGFLKPCSIRVIVLD